VLGEKVEGEVEKERKREESSVRKEERGRDEEGEYREVEKGRERE